MKFAPTFFIITIICFVFSMNSSKVYSQKDTNKQKLYIAAIKNQGQTQSISKRVHSVVKLSIFENFGTQFHVLDDEAIKIMYSQAEKIIASGNEDMSSLTQIANGLNADIIIYGELSINDNNDINISLTSLERKNHNLGIKSIVKLTCHESQIDHYAIEAGKKLINPNYKIIMNAETNLAYSTKVDGLDISIMNFTSSDDIINQMIAYLKELISKGDGYYYEDKYDQALLVYNDVLDRIQKKLLPEQQSKLTNFTSELKNRIDRVNIVKIKLHERMGDDYYSNFKFLKSIKEYEECILLSNKIFDSKNKIQMKDKFNRKVETVTTTAKNYTVNVAKNHLDEALYLNLKDEKKLSKKSLLKAQVFIEHNSFTTMEVITTYNATAKLLGIEKLDLSKIPNFNLKIGDRGPAGGWIFYDKGYSSDGWRYLEAAPEDHSLAIWGCDKNFVFNIDDGVYSSSGYRIGYGRLNTQTIINNCNEPGIAAKVAASYSGGGQNDWFLPSCVELELMYENLYKKGIGNFTDDYYWSSTEHNASTVYLLLFSRGYKVTLGKSYGRKAVRAVRAFDI